MVLVLFFVGWLKKMLCATEVPRPGGLGAHRHRHVEPDWGRCRQHPLERLAACEGRLGRR